MRGFVALLLSVLVAIGIGVGVVAAGGPSISSESTAQQFAKRVLASLDTGGKYEQLLVTVNDGGSSTADRVLDQLRYGVELSFSGSATLSHPSFDDESVDLYLASASQRLVELRLVEGSAVYVWADLGAIARLPGLSAADRAGLGLASSLSEQWFQLPPNLVGKFLSELRNEASRSSAATTTTLPSAEGQAIVQQLETALNDNSTISMSPASNGEEDVHASLRLQPFLQQFVSDVLPAIAKASSDLPRTIPSIPKSTFSSVKGTVAADLYADAASATFHRLVLGYTNGTTKVAVTMTASHHVVVVGIPLGSRMLPKAVINAIRQGVKGAPLT